MARYIELDAVVAEIKRRKELVDDPIILDNDLIIGERNAYIRLLSFINTFEVKEVDLENIIREEYLKRRCYGNYSSIGEHVLWKYI